MVYVVTRGYELENEKNNSPNQYTPNEHEYLQWSWPNKFVPQLYIYLYKYN